MEAAYWIAMIAFGTASGIAITAQRQHNLLAPLVNLIASISGIVDIILAVAAFLRFPIGQAIAIVLTAFFVTGMISAKLPLRLAGGQIFLFTTIGVAAISAYFFIPPSTSSV